MAAFAACAPAIVRPSTALARHVRIKVRVVEEEVACIGCSLVRLDVETLCDRARARRVVRHRPQAPIQPIWL